MDSEWRFYFIYIYIRNLWSVLVESLFLFFIGMLANNGMEYPQMG